MQLYLDSYGAFLGVKDEMFWVKPLEGEGRLIAVAKVRTILLSKGVRISTDAMMLALENEISILLLDGIGRTLGQVWSGQYGSVSTIRKNQAKFADSVQGMVWVRGLLIQKIENQKYVLNLFEQSGHLQEKNQQFAFKNAVQSMDLMLQKFQEYKFDKNLILNEIAASFRGWEGTASRAYFYCISLILPEEYEFKKRHKHPAYDRFNACINYMYGILYGMIEVSLIKAGIDPYMGVLHTDRYNRPTLVFDIIDTYRHWADEAAIRLFLAGNAPHSCFMEGTKEGLWLSSEGKKVVVEVFTKQMNEMIDYKGNRRKRTSHLDLDAARLATMLKELVL